MAAASNGFLGTFATSSDLALKYSPKDYPGCWANVGSGTVTKYVSSGTTWQPAAAGSSGNTGIWRPLGGQGCTSWGGGAGLSVTYYHVVEAEAPFVAVRLWLFSREQQNVSRDWEFIVAPTENTTQANTTTAFIPQTTPTTGWPNAGVKTSYNVMATTNDSTIHGWQRGTWGGNNKSPILYPGTDPTSTQGIPAAFGYTAIPGTIVSDWVPCRSVPASGGGRPHLMLRLFHPVKAGDSYSWYNVDQLDVNGWKYPYGYYRAKADGKAFGRTWYSQEQASIDGVNTLTNMPGSVLSFATNNSTNMGSPFYAIEFMYETPARSVLGMGDSVMESGGGQTYGLDSWLTRAVNMKSSVTQPWNVINGGMSTCHSMHFLPQLEIMVREGARPTDVVFPAISTNESQTKGAGTWNAFSADTVKNRNMQVIELCKRIGARPLIYTSIYPTSNPGTGGPRSIYENIDNWARNVCASGAATLVDLRTGMKSEYIQPDQYHLSPSGIDYAANILYNVL